MPRKREPTHAYIKGRVVDARDNTTPLGGLDVHLYAYYEGKPGVYLDADTTGEDGSFLFDFSQGFPTEDPVNAVFAVVSNREGDETVTSVFGVSDLPFDLGDVSVWPTRAVGGGEGGNDDGGDNGEPPPDEGEDPLKDIKGSLDVVEKDIETIAAYMATAPETTGPTVGARGPDAPLDQVVNNALTTVLGQRLRAEDPKAFLASLRRAFTPAVVEGRTVYEWTPRTYAVETELGGAITGAQASLYHRAKIAIDDALPLLDGLMPLDPESDEEDVGALTSIVRTELVELGNELGREGGPRPQRVEQLFQLLTSNLDTLGVESGYTDSNRQPVVDHVVTVDEERKQTDFLVVRDYVDSLYSAWNGMMSRTFLGTQLILVSRALSVTAESVDETMRAMDAAFLGPAERQVVRIEYQDEGGSVRFTIEELLSWIRSFATEEGPSLIEDAGRYGVVAVRNTADRLHGLVEGALNIIQDTDPAELPHGGLRHPRVLLALRELEHHLDEMFQLAGQIPPPKPPNGNRGRWERRRFV